MKKLKILLICALALLPGSRDSYAQLAFNLGASFPGAVYTYNGYDSYYSKLRIGFDVGLQYNLGLNSHLDAVVSADFIRHGLGKIAKSQMGYNYANYPSYLNFPVMAGLAYKIDFDDQGFLDPSHHAFIELKGGWNASTLSRSVFFDESGTRQTVRYDVEISPAFSAGVGMRFSESGAFSVRFIYLGDITMRERGNDGSEFRYSPRMVDIRYTYFF